MNSPKKQYPSVYPRGIYLLPSMMTGINIILGFYSIIIVTSQKTNHLPPDIAKRAAVLIILAALFDAFDGRIARMTKTTSPFGAQLDSIADVVSFGLAPSILIYHFALTSFPRFGWIAALLFLLAGAIRLARFNVLDSIHSFTSKRYFIGLPIPAAAIAIALAVTVLSGVEQSSALRLFILLMVYSLAFLMVSSFHFKSFKDIDLKRRRPVGAFFILVIGLVIVLHEPFYVLSALMATYILSGIMMQISPRWMRNIFTKMEKGFNEVKVLDDEEEIENDVSLSDSDHENSIDAPDTNSGDEALK